MYINTLHTVLHSCYHILYFVTNPDLQVRLNKIERKGEWSLYLLNRLCLLSSSFFPAFFPTTPPPPQPRPLLFCIFTHFSPPPLLTIDLPVLCEILTGHVIHLIQEHFKHESSPSHPEQLTESLVTAFGRLSFASVKNNQFFCSWNRILFVSRHHY